MQQQQKGFTLIELIVVIVIIAILAAIAIPLFIAQTTNARLAALAGLEGAIASAVSLAQVEYIVQGKPSSVTIVTSVGPISVNAGSGVPLATYAASPSVNTPGGIVNIVQTSFVPDTSTAGQVTYNFSPAITGCNLVYTGATGAIAINSAC